MKFIASLLFATLAFAQNVTDAQTPTPAKPAAHAAAATHATAKSHGCAKVPELSPKIPALPAGLPCAKPLYTITTTPPAKLIDISPFESPDLGESLGIPAPATITLSYVDTKVGTGELAAPHKFYSMKYHGYLTDGTEFDSTDKHPEQGPTFTFHQGPQGPQGQRGVIVGWDTGIAGMRIGGKRRLFIPFQLAYGPNGKPPTIPAKSWLIFDVEFVAQSDTEPAPKNPPAPPNQPSAIPTPPKPGPAAQTAPAMPSPTPAAAPAPTAPPTPAAAPPVTAPPVVTPKPQ
jgi:peptidylprolyl isomerase